MFNDLIGQIAICESEDELNEVFSQPDSQKIIQQFQIEKFQKKLLISELAKTSKKFRGSTLENIQWLFEKMQLKNELLNNLKSKEWHTKAKAVQQLALLKQDWSIKEIFALTNHENILLRMEAQIAIVKLTGFEGLNFLDTISHPISEWQQLRLIQELSGQAITENVNICQWLQSKNDSVVHFALRLIEIYQQHKYYDDAAICLSHSSSGICRTAVATLSFISNETTADLLIEHYLDYNAATQLDILKILQNDGTESHLEFLLPLLHHPDDSFKMAAAAAIRKIRSANMEKIEASVEKSSHPWNVILPQLKMEPIT
ncbi:MAG TPA: hypothetical protein VN722_04130 [Hanamia sp.]|nr:hypothetical protein [Hanamia sp.]